MSVLRWGYRRAARAYPFEPVWNRPYFAAAKKSVSIPVFAVGGIRTVQDCVEILEGGEADMVGIGRPFYAEPELAARLLAGDQEGAFCESSNRCVVAQQLGLRARCYNPNVARRLARARQRVGS
jgi:2,4-dienoyl-CoA reductase-like NADH-dependent reductase (Old Yellow Enzyme family)